MKGHAAHVVQHGISLIAVVHLIKYNLLSHLISKFAEPIKLFSIFYKPLPS